MNRIANGNALWLAALLGLGCASAGGRDAAGSASAADAGAAEEVVFAFDWPEAYLAEVDARMITSGGRDLRYGFALRTEPDADRVWLRHGSFRVESPPGSGRFALLAPDSRETEVIAGLQPDFAVDRGGVLLEVDDAGALALVDAAMDRGALANSPYPEEQTRALLRRAMVMRQSRRAQELWSALVELWAGASYELESVYELDLRQSLDARPELEMDFVGELEVGGWMPCPGTDGGPRCVELSLESRLADPDSRQLMREMGVSLRELGLDELAPGVLEALEGREVAELVVEYDERETIRLVCEPDGLIPYELDHRAARVLALDFPGRGEERLDRAREIRYRFRYAD